MNERIEALAKQAGMVMYPTGLGISENTLWGDRNIGKLADLIIQECARIARAVPCPMKIKRQEIGLAILGILPVLNQAIALLNTLE